MTRFARITAIGIMLLSTFTVPVSAQVIDYQAVLENPALEQGNVATGAETWQCKGNVCSTRTTQAAVGACAKLAERVGRVRSFGQIKGKPIGAADLATCNASARRSAAGNVGGEVPPDRGRTPPPAPPVPRPPTDRTFYFGDKLVVDFDGGPVTLGPGETWPLSWFCFDRVCFSNVVDRTLSVEECRDLNLKTAFRVAAVTSPRGRFSPDQIRLCNRPEVVALEFVVTTGRDGIRGSNEDIAGLQFLVATRRDPVGTVYSGRFFFNEGLRERTTESRTAPVGEYHRRHALALEGLRSITLSYRSGSTRAIGEQGDSFDLAALTIRAHIKEMDGREYTRDIYQGTPMRRFSGGDRWEIAFPEPVFDD